LSEEDRVHFQHVKPLPVVPVSETGFYVDVRYHARIAFTHTVAGKAPRRPRSGALGTKTAAE
jgi:hypothetical protein